MTRVEALGLVGLIFMGAPIACVALLVVREFWVARQRRRWNRYAEALIDRCERRLETRHANELARRIRDDAEVAWLENLFDLPTAPDGPGLAP